MNISWTWIKLQLVYAWHCCHECEPWKNLWNAFGDYQSLHFHGVLGANRNKINLNLFSETTRKFAKLQKKKKIKRYWNNSDFIQLKINTSMEVFSWYKFNSQGGDWQFSYVPSSVKSDRIFGKWRKLLPMKIKAGKITNKKFEGDSYINFFCLWNIYWWDNFFLLTLTDFTHPYL